MTARVQGGRSGVPCLFITIFFFGAGLAPPSPPAVVEGVVAVGMGVVEGVGVETGAVAAGSAACHFLSSPSPSDAW